jgi:putative ABC transport system ATP-binding protein
VSLMLTINNLSKVFNAGSVNEKLALKNINLKINPGDFITVIGGNGAGKSTLLNLIAGVYTSDAGSITLESNVITREPEYIRAKYISRVFQDPMLGTASEMTIEENLAIAMRRGKKRSLKLGLHKKDGDLFREHLSFLELGLENRLTSKVGLLSGGQRQALSLLMATINQPKLLLLDEHTAALDPKTAEKVITISEKIIKSYNLTTLMITHNMKAALKYGNRIVMMNEGTIMLDLDYKKKQNLKVQDLLNLFNNNNSCVTDKMLLA